MTALCKATPARPATPNRRAMLAKIHIAKKELALDDETYGDILLRETGESSAAGLSDANLHRLLVEFRRLGWTGHVGTKPAGRPNVRLILALWNRMGPFLREHNDTALRSFVRRQTVSKLHPQGVDAPEFLSPAQANKVIEGLKAWLARERAAAEKRAPRDPASSRPDAPAMEDSPYAI